MIANIYAVYDKLAGTYANPFMLNKRVANRTFRWMQQDTDAKDLEDKEVHLLGTFDNETGQITSCEPYAVYNLEKEVEA